MSQQLVGTVSGKMSSRVWYAETDLWGSITVTSEYCTHYNIVCPSVLWEAQKSSQLLAIYIAHAGATVTFSVLFLDTILMSVVPGIGSTVV